MKDLSARFRKIEDEIFAKYPDYQKCVYGFIYQSLEFATRNLNLLPRQHLTGVQLVQLGVVPFAFHQWGFLALAVLHHWGIHQGVDIGEIVQRLVTFGVLQKDEKDDFEGFRKCNLQELLTSKEKI